MRGPDSLDDRTRNPSDPAGPDSGSAGFHAHDSASVASPDHAEDAGPDVAEAAAAAEIVRVLMKSVRAAQLYGPGNPVYQRLIDGFRAVIASALDRAPIVELSVEESGLRWNGKLHSTGDGRDTIAFALYRDGIRRLTFLPGFEDELERFVGVLVRAREVDRDGDDLITLLWEQEFESFRYGYVAAFTEDAELPGMQRIGATAPVVTRDDVLRDVGPGAQPSGAGASDLAALAAQDELEETLHFLDEGERAELEAAVRAEWSRDLRTAVVDALFDRLEDSGPERQSEILDILSQWLPILLGRGDYAAATRIVRELGALLGRGVLAPDQAAAAEGTLRQLSEPEVLEQIIGLLEEGHVPSDDLPHYFAHLQPEALPTLVRALDAFAPGPVAERLHSAVDELASRHPETLLALLDNADTVLVAGAVRLTGWLALAGATPRLLGLLQRGAPALRLAAVDALVRLPSSASLDGLQRALDDPDRDVRIAAVRGLAALRYHPAAAAVEEAIRGRVVKSADLTERLAFFEAYGVLGGAGAVALLDHLLNGKNLFGRRPASDVRACAAMALGRIPGPAARKALGRAASADDPVVRTAVARALRGEAVHAS